MSVTIPKWLLFLLALVLAGIQQAFAMGDLVPPGTWARSLHLVSVLLVGMGVGGVSLALKAAEEKSSPADKATIAAQDKVIDKVLPAVPTPALTAVVVTPAPPTP